MPGCGTRGPRLVPWSEGQGVLSHFCSQHKDHSRSTLGLSLSCPTSPRPKEPGSLCASPPAPHPQQWEQDGVASAGTGDTAAIPWECPAEHMTGQPSVRNEDRPLFTVTNKRDKKK